MRIPVPPIPRPVRVCRPVATGVPVAEGVVVAGTVVGFAGCCGFCTVWAFGAVLLADFNWLWGTAPVVLAICGLEGTCTVGPVPDACA